MILDTQKDFEVDARRGAAAHEYTWLSVSGLSEVEIIVQDQLREAEDTRSKWLKKRSKVSRNIQQFAAKFSGFLEAYSGIVEVVKGADQQYGGLAYGTLSLFFIVRKHLLYSNR